jgi:hypothetical protein
VGEREGKDGDEGRGDIKDVVVCKSKALMCLPWSKKLFYRMIMAPKPIPHWAGHVIQQPQAFSSAAG